MKKILLTGANGFIGKNILEGLQEKYELFCPSSKELDLSVTEVVQGYLEKHSFVKDIVGVNCKICVGESRLKGEYTGNNSRMMKEVGKFEDYDVHGIEDMILRNVDSEMEKTISRQYDFCNSTLLSVRRKGVKQVGDYLLCCVENEVED